MNFREFEARAQQIYDSIPERFREGVEGLAVERAALPHPTLPEIYTLGECLSDYYPTEFGGAGEVRSTVVLYHGSFVALSELDEEFGWEEELYETVVHEVKHHRESMALEDALEETDYAEDQNFARREGERFDPFFHRSGTPVAEGIWEVDRDLFADVPLRRRDLLSGEVVVRVDGETFRIPLDRSPGPDVDFVFLRETRDGRGEVYAVLVRSHGLRGWLARLLGGARLEVGERELSVDSSGGMEK